MSALRKESAGASRAELAARASLANERKGIRALLPFVGPAFIAAVAYIDPGNYATNIQSGSEFGYKLLWVVVMANLMAMLIQNMSAKVGIATGKNLPELCRERFSTPVSIILWIVSEIAAIATDIAAISRCDARTEPSSGDPATGCDGDYGNCHVPDSDVGSLRISAAGTIYRRVSSLDWCVLRSRNLVLTSGRGSGAVSQRRTLGPRPECHSIGGGHHRGNGDATRSLSTFRSHAAPDRPA